MIYFTLINIVLCGKIKNLKIEESKYHFMIYSSMVTTEEKITGVESIIERAEQLGHPSIVDSGEKCLKKLQEQLKQEQKS